MQVPDKVNKAAQSDIKRFGGCVDYLGKYQGMDAFYLNYDSDCEGDPSIVYLFDGKTVDTITGMLAVSISCSLLKD